ncbi:GFA family protein [Stappia stellulata]|uniref:GFA family protein n=1 Tax=Stappia stellulata TaxID=71235 RepID=UPI00040017CB|nr:GFA family protein [Stappia stellulata]
MTQPVSGGCACGAVTFEITGSFEAFFLCHCARCRKDTGSAHAANLFSSSATIEWRTGQERVKTYRVPDSRHEKSFCRDCGSALPGLQMDGTLLVVPAGSLDSDIGMRPTAHICCASRADWDDNLETVPRIDGLPG